MVTAGSKEGRQLEQVKKVFEDVYRAETKNPTGEGGVKYALSQPGAASSQSQYAYMKPFADQLTDYQNGNITGDDALVVGATPDVLKKIGLVSLPMTINQKHVGDALNGTYKGTQQEKLDHTFTTQELATLPEKLADPVAIIHDKRSGKTSASESNIDVIVEMTVASGKNVLAAIQINGNGRINGIRIDTNKVSTVHGNTDTIARLVDAINENQNGNVAVFYINNDKTTKVLQRTGNPIPSGLSNLDSFIHSITDPGSPVKMRITSVTESQQFKRWFGDWQNHPENASKVVNADGTPKVMYHGSPAQFTVFDRRKARSSGHYGKGFYFTDSTSHAGTYGNLYSVYLNIRNPLQSGVATVSRDQVRSYLETVAENEDYSIENYGTYDVDAILDIVMGKSAITDAFKVINDINATAIGDMVEAAELFNSVSGTSFDGIVAPTETVAFYPEQIKSATDNIGTFDKSNPDIRYSVSRQGQTDDLGPLPWQIKGEDVALDIGPVIQKDVEETATTEDLPIRKEYADGTQPKERISLEDYANNESPAWRNVEYADEETKASITQETHDRMIADGNVVIVSEDTMQAVAQSFPDLRSMKKQERTPILKDAIKKLKSNIRQFLTGLSNQSFEFEVNGKILDAKLYSTGINEVLEKVTQEKANMLYSTEEIFRNAQYLYSTPDYDGDPHVYRWNYFYTPVQIGENTVGVRITVRYVAKGVGMVPESQIYNWGIKKDASLDGGRRGPKVASSDVSSDAFANSIPENGSVVNDDIEPVAVSKTETTMEDIAPVRDDLPMREDIVKSGSKQRKWIGTSTESDVVDGQVLPADPDQELIHYQPISNKKTLGNANARLDRMGYEGAVGYLNNRITSRKVALDDIALGERLIQEAVKRGDTKTAGDLIMDISILGTELGQKVQALSIIKRLTPEGQLRMLQKTVEQGKAKGDKAFEGVEITQDMIDYILKTYSKDGTYDQAELNKRVEDVKQKIADQMKVTAMDYINEWRYLAMLGNPKTHIRNIVSNVAMWGTRQVKNAIARTIEDIAPVKNRTKTWKFASEDVKNFAKQTTIEMYKGDTDNKYSEGGSIKAKRQIFKTKAGNWVSKANSDALSGEDTFFSKPAYQSALSEYLTANGITTQEDIEKNPKIVAEAKVYAMDQAKEATFQQDSYIANKISEIERKNPLFNIAIGSVLPFKKTPINIAKTAVAYSPIGIARNIYDAVQISKGNM